MSVADKLGLGPTRTVVKNADRTYTVHVKPGALADPSRKGGSVTLSEQQYQGYLAWQNGQLIQDALPTLSSSQREMLMSGLTTEDLREIWGDPDEVG